jgi:hypothetical protein
MANATVSTSAAAVLNPIVLLEVKISLIDEIVSRRGL